MDRPKILLADDSATIRKVVELTFADEGIDVVSVPDGDAAMIAFVADQPDIVIADVNMPGIGGYKLCEMIKQDESTHDIPVVLLTGTFEPFDAGEASRVGANYYFTKPFQSIRALVDKVNDLLENRAFDHDIFEDTADIDELYSTSFADTLEIPANITATDIDDVQFADFVRVEDNPEELAASSIPEPEPIEVVKIEQFDDPAFDDELIEMIQHNRPVEAEVETNGPVRIVDEVEEPVVNSCVNSDPFASIAMDAVPNVVSETDSTLLKFEFAETESVEVSEPKATFSAEMIEAIAERVLERLSDKVVRDIAQEAVPRITENLIREALESESREH